MCVCLRRRHVSTEFDYNFESNPNVWDVIHHNHRVKWLLKLYSLLCNYTSLHHRTFHGLLTAFDDAAGTFGICLNSLDGIWSQQSVMKSRIFSMVLFSRAHWSGCDGGTLWTAGIGSLLGSAGTNTGLGGTAAAAGRCLLHVQPSCWSCCWTGCGLAGHQPLLLPDGG